MTVYHIDGITKEYEGETEARLDPEEAKLGVDRYLIPANSTTIKPPVAQENMARIFINDRWEYVEDYRGKTIYNTLNPLQMEKVIGIGQIPKGWTLLIPFDNCKWDGFKWVTDTQKVIELTAIQQAITQKAEDIELNLPSWAEVESYISKVDSIAKAQAVLLKLARVVYWLAKNKAE